MTRCKLGLPWLLNRRVSKALWKARAEAAALWSVTDSGNRTQSEAGTLATIRDDSIPCRVRCKHATSPLSTQEATLPTLPKCSRLQRPQGRDSWDRGCGKGRGDTEAVWKWRLGMVGFAVGRERQNQSSSFSVEALAKRWPVGSPRFRLLYFGRYLVACPYLNLR